MNSSSLKTHIFASLYFAAGIVFIILGVIFSPPPGNIPVIQILLTAAAFLTLGKAVGLILKNKSGLPDILLSEALKQYYVIVVLTAVCFESLCGYFFVERIPFHDNASFYSLFHDNLQSLNYFGTPAWWFPHNQYGFPGYFYSILGNMNCLSPVFMSLSLVFWILGQFGVHVTNILPLYIWYFGAIVPFLFSLAVWVFARQILRSTPAIILVSILAAFSPGVILNYGDLGLLEPAAYGLFLGAAYIRFVNRPGKKSFLALLLSMLVFAVTVNYTLIIWNLLFLPLLFMLVLIPGKSLTEVRTFLSGVSGVKWAFMVILFVLCMAPSILTFSQKGDIVRTTLADKGGKYLHLNYSPGNPLEALLAGTPGVGFFGKNTEKGPYVNFPVVLGSGYMGYSYMGILTIPLAIIGLLYGQAEWRIRLFIMMIVFFIMILFSSYSPAFLFLLNFHTPLTQNSHFSDVLYRSGAFILWILLAGLGMDALQEKRDLYRKLIIAFVVLLAMSCTLHLYLTHGNLIILGLILGFTLIIGLSYFVVLVWLMKNQISAYGSVIVGILLLLVFCDVSTMSHLHVRSVMFPNYPRQTLLANFDAQNADKIGLSHYWPNGQADTTLSLKSFMNLRRKGLSSGDLPEYALFNSIRIADEILSDDLRGAISREYLVLDSGSLKTEIIKSQINENQTGRNDLAGDVVLKHRTYTMTQLSVSSNEDAFLFVRDGYHPFWKSSVNGLEEKVFRAMGNYKAIAIPKGESVIQFHFQPTGIPLSIAIAYAIIIVTAALWIRSALSGSDQSHNAVLYG